MPMPMALAAQLGFSSSLLLNGMTQTCEGDTQSNRIRRRSVNGLLAVVLRRQRGGRRGRTMSVLVLHVDHPEPLVEIWLQSLPPCQTWPLPAPDSLDPHPTCSDKQATRSFTYMLAQALVPTGPRAARPVRSHRGSINPAGPRKNPCVPIVTIGYYTYRMP